MATLLVAGSTTLEPQPSERRRRRLSFRRRVDPTPTPTTPTPTPTPTRAELLSAQAAKTAQELLLWTEIEEWQQTGSEHIHTGYRRATPSIADCLSSWLYIHNETVNIYSHIVGAAIFLLLPIPVFAVCIPPRYHAASALDILVCSAYFLGVAVCFALSTIFHTFMAHSQALYLQGMKLDFQGVLILMWSATVPLIHYTFPCASAQLRMFYMGLFTVLAWACSAVTFMPRFSGPQLGPYRAALFGAFGVGSFALPIGHGLLREGLGEMWQQIGLGWILATVACNGIGVGLYAMKFPEKWFPRRFDIFGASHQLMHICVVAAALTYTFAVVQALEYHLGRGKACR